jgi:hypothetical protein
VGLSENAKACLDKSVQQGDGDALLVAAHHGAGAGAFMNLGAIQNPGFLWRYVLCCQGGHGSDEGCVGERDHDAPSLGVDTVCQILSL